LLQDLGFLAFTLDHVDIIMPTRSAGPGPHAAQKRRIDASRAAVCASSMSTAASSAVASSTDTCRHPEGGVRDVVMEVCLCVA